MIVDDRISHNQHFTSLCPFSRFMNAKSTISNLAFFKMWSNWMATHEINCLPWGVKGTWRHQPGINCGWQLLPGAETVPRCCRWCASKTGFISCCSACNKIILFPKEQNFWKHSARSFHLCLGTMGMSEKSVPYQLLMSVLFQEIWTPFVNVGQMNRIE